MGYNLPHYFYGDSSFFTQLSFFRRLKWALKGKVLKYFFKRDADAFVVQTDDVNRRLREWLPTDKVHTVSNTLSEPYEFPTNVSPKLPEKKTDEYRFLILSACYPHKSLAINPKVVDELPASLRHRVRFVLTLPEEIFQSSFSQYNRGSIINVGPVKPEEGPALYMECDALFLPTLLECFLLRMQKQ